MKQTFLLLVALLNCMWLFAQTEINSTATDNHVEVRGSKIKIIPPKGYTVAINFLGFQQVETNSSIIVHEIAIPYSQTSKGLSKESLLKQGVEVQSIEQITLNGLPGLLVTGTQSAYGTEFSKYTLAFGTATETILINGMVPKNDLHLEISLKNALLSAVYDANKVLTPLDGVDFQISTDGTGFVFAENHPNMLIYNRDGKTPTESADKSSLVVAKAFSKVAIEDRKEFATNRIKMLPVQITKIHSVIPIEINGLQGYEISAEGVNRKTGTKEMAYQVMLFVDNSYYILFGSSENNFSSNLIVFKKLAHTFKQK